MRDNSVINYLICSHCRKEVIIKVPFKEKLLEYDISQGLNEYLIQRKLETKYPQSHQFGTIIPFGYMDKYGAIIMERIRGDDLKTYLLKSNHHLHTKALGCAGAWLRYLHNSCPRGYENQHIDVEARIQYLDYTYGNPLRRNKTAYSAFSYLKKESAKIKTISIPATWGHGDYKPENIIYDGVKYIGLDIQLKDYSVFVYDLASFLNHLIIMGQGIRYRRMKSCYSQLEKGFLEGYGNIGQADKYLLHWIQLYFMLCYWGRYQLQNRFFAAYANGYILPTLTDLQAKIYSERIYEVG
ncbi:phosphotransferase [Candidatus Nitrosoglobus terrae]|nr:phosphotransferase [Candidatus Nitrosoglobus terrae]